MDEISFSVSAYDSGVIKEIARRAAALGKRHGIKIDVLDAMMDVTAVHANGNPLRLDGLLAADEFNFAHDILGIRDHLNRETGKLMDCFRPRYSQPISETKAA
jgi:hypothetical protein